MKNEKINSKRGRERFIFKKVPEFPNCVPQGSSFLQMMQKLFFLNMGQPPPLFVQFCPFVQKKTRSRQDSNLDCQSIRQGH